MSISHWKPEGKNKIREKSLSRQFNRNNRTKLFIKITQLDRISCRLQGNFSPLFKHANNMKLRLLCTVLYKSHCEIIVELYTGDKGRYVFHSLMDRTKVARIERGFSLFKVLRNPHGILFAIRCRCSLHICIIFIPFSN